jgi:hypothetical protein
MAVIANGWSSQDNKEIQNAKQLLQYLIRQNADYLEVKSANGYTPLMLAYQSQNFEAAEILISAGANQAVRDSLGRNLVHLALAPLNGSSHLESTKVDKLLSIIDKRLIRSLFLERCSEGPTGMNPCTRWVTKLEINESANQATDKNDPKPSDKAIATFETMMKYTDMEALRMLDGSGQLPLHICTKKAINSILEVMVKRYPQLVLMENGMGQTATELASAIYIRHVACDTLISNRWGHYVHVHVGPPSHYETLKILRSTENKLAGKQRVLVSVLQASEVAKRLAEAKKHGEDTNYRRGRYSYSYNRYGTGPQNYYEDEVERWLSR